MLSAHAAAETQVPPDWASPIVQTPWWATWRGDVATPRENAESQVYLADISEPRFHVFQHATTKQNQHNNKNKSRLATAQVWMRGRDSKILLSGFYCEPLCAFSQCFPQVFLQFLDEYH